MKKTMKLTLVVMVVLVVAGCVNHEQQHVDFVTRPNQLADCEMLMRRDMTNKGSRCGGYPKDFLAAEYPDFLIKLHCPSLRDNFWFRIECRGEMSHRNRPEYGDDKMYNIPPSSTISCSEPWKITCGGSSRREIAIGGYLSDADVNYRPLSDTER